MEYNKGTNCMKNLIDSIRFHWVSLVVDRPTACYGYPHIGVEKYLNTVIKVRPQWAWENLHKDKVFEEAPEWVIENHPRWAATHEQLSLTHTGYKHILFKYNLPYMLKWHYAWSVSYNIGTGEGPIHKQVDLLHTDRDRLCREYPRWVFNHALEDILLEHNPKWVSENLSEWLFKTNKEVLFKYNKSWCIVNKPEWLIEEKFSWLVENKAQWLVNHHPLLLRNYLNDNL